MRWELLQPYEGWGHSHLVHLPLLKQENGDLSPFSGVSLRERGSEASGQLFHGRAREGSFEARYQQPFEDFRISQEHLADHFDSRERR